MRIDEIIDYLNISRAEFERRAGLSNGYTRNLGGIPGADKLESILIAFPMISRSWLLTGTGDMLLNSYEADKSNIKETVNLSKTSVDPTISDLLEIIKSQQETIQELVKRLPPQS